MKNNGLTRLLASAALVALVVPAGIQAERAVAQTAPQKKPEYGSFGVDLSAEDTSVKPGDDFFDYANGTWLKNTKIAPDRSVAGPIVTLSDKAEEDVRAILEDVAKNPATYGASGKQIGDFYASWMNEAAIEAAGTKPLQPYLARINAVQNKQDLQRLFMTVGYASPIDLDIEPGLADPTRYQVETGQSGLGMPRDYYVNDGPKFEAYRKAYRAYIQQMLELGGVADASAKADAIFALETSMAKDQWTPTESRDVEKMNDPETLAGLQKKAPDFDWPLLFQTFGIADPGTVLMAQNTAVAAMGKIMTATPLDTWKDYLTFHFISSHASYLPKAFDQTSFDFYSKTLRGVEQQRARWKRGVALVNGALGEAVGKIYVQKHFPPEAQRQMSEMIENLRAAYKQNITNSTWMDAATKKAALEKLAAFDPRIGHPTHYIDYSSMPVSRDNLLANVMASGKFEHDLSLSRYPKPVDRSLWDMTPQTINAYYDPSKNQITFPAAILQPPFFDPNADPAVNYGAIGAVIGHEMGHGFDDQGSKFGPHGKLENWWTPASRKAFNEHTAALVKQYDAFEPLPGEHIKGAFTLGENIGDLSGLENAYAAYQRYQQQHGKAPVIDGLTGDQRFFLGFAQVWRMKEREGALRAQLAADPHSPAKYRADGSVRNLDAWYKAFDVKPGDALYLPPDQRVRIW